VYLLDGAQIIDPPAMGMADSVHTYIYYKNATVSQPDRAYCNLRLGQDLIEAGGQTRVPLSWTHCSGGLSVQLQLAGGGVGTPLRLNQVRGSFPYRARQA
jgi:hypothetical protein